MVILSCHIRSNPIILFHINELQIDSSGWRLELKNINAGFFPSLDSCYLSTITDTAYFKPGLTADSFLVVTQDSMLGNLSVNRLGDIIGFHYLDEHPIDELRFGSIPGSSNIVAPQIHQSICLREWREDIQRYCYYLDNTPTFGTSNDTLNAKGYLTGIITDSIGNSLSGVEIVYDYYSSYPNNIDISVFSDSTGKFIFKDYARLNTIKIRKNNYQTEYRTLQIWPEDTVTIAVALQSVVDIINPNTPPKADYFSLSQNFPNPFNNSTSFVYSLPIADYIEISVYDLSGKLVVNLFSGEQKPGEYKVFWNAESVSSGIYIYQAKTNNFIKNKKCLLIK